MAWQHPTPRSLMPRLRPTPERVAAAAALHDPSLLLRLLARQRPADQQRPTTPHDDTHR